MANLDQLKAKYQSAIDLAKKRGVVLTNVHVENELLLIRGAAPNQDIKNEVWEVIKKIDANHPDPPPPTTIDPSLKVPETIYEVVARRQPLEDREEVLRRRQQVHELTSRPTRTS